MSFTYIRIYASLITSHLNKFKLKTFVLFWTHIRFAEIRDTLQGKQEERLPFFSFTFPPWFKQVHPRAYANFVYNSRHLTTPFDIHETLRNVLNFQTVKEGDRRKRAISLFDKVKEKKSRRKNTDLHLRL